MNWEPVVTYRQFMAWQEWLDEDMSNPGKVEHYLMQIAAEVRQSVPTKSPKRVSLKDFRIPFKRETKRRQSREEAARLSKMAWIGYLGPTKITGLPSDVLGPRSEEQP